MRTTAWTLLSPYTRLERVCHVDYVSRVRSCGGEVVCLHLGRSSHERVGRDPSLSGKFRGILSRREAQYAQATIVSLSSADGEWEKPERLDGGGFDSLVTLGLEDKVEDQDDNGPLVVVDESGAGWAGEGFTEQSEGEADSHKHTKSGDKEAEYFAMVELGESFTTETGEMKKQREETETKSRASKAARASETNMFFLEERGDPLDKETLAKGAGTFKESTEPRQGRPLSPQESACGETASKEEHDGSRKPMREGSGNNSSDVYSECKASRDATNPGSMQSTKRVRGTNGLEGLSADEVEERLIEAGVLHRDGAMFDTDELSDEGVYNEVDVPDGSEACRILVDALGCDEADINHLRERYAPLRGEPWYRREPIPGAKVGKKVLDVFFLEETLPELLDLLLGNEGEGGVGLTAEQVRKMLLRTPALVGVEASEASDVVAYLGKELGLDGKGQLAEALARCPPMLMYNARDNLRQKVQYYLDTLSWSKEDVRSMLAEYPDLLSIKLEDGVIEVVEYLRSGIRLQSSIVSDMIRQYPQVLEVRPKRLKAVVKYLWKVFELPMSDIAAILSQSPRACCLEAEANLAPLRHFFEQELFVEDTARIGRLVYKFPRLLFQDVETQLKPRAGEFRKAMGLIGVQPLPPRVRSRPKRNTYRVDDTKHNSSGRNRGKRPSGERFGGKEGRWPERRGYGGQSSRNR